ncbi:MAG: hypothetical protein ABI833_07785 [Acidobacteriota bacterium]
MQAFAGGKVRHCQVRGTVAGHLEPDAAEQAALTEIRNLRRQGHTLRGIALALNDQAAAQRYGRTGGSIARPNQYRFLGRLRN